jgi:hypothetical protein
MKHPEVTKAKYKTQNNTRASVVHVELFGSFDLFLVSGKMFLCDEKDYSKSPVEIFISRNKILEIRYFVTS